MFTLKKWFKDQGFLTTSGKQTVISVRLYFRSLSFNSHQFQKQADFSKIFKTKLLQTSPNSKDFLTKHLQPRRKFTWEQKNKQSQIFHKVSRKRRSFMSCLHLLITKCMCICISDRCSKKCLCMWLLFTCPADFPWYSLRCWLSNQQQYSGYFLKSFFHRR